MPKKVVKLSRAKRKKIAAKYLFKGAQSIDNSDKTKTGLLYYKGSKRNSSKAIKIYPIKRNYKVKKTFDYNELEWPARNRAEAWQGSSGVKGEENNLVASGRYNDKPKPFGGNEGEENK